ncbi:mechanosensitive ion channel domain-containing protein [Erythrobacter sp. MTPC3]|uniref:mechanosensitive ion channel domain-containing protein n=1 Tax=Erythrobacter sp. MTPC3 TaxID=3056564 RepID=UPI0036F2961F
MTFSRLLLIVSALLLSVPAYAALPGLEGEGGESAETQTVDTEIAQGQSAGEDSRITQRIKGIFSELPDFETVEVSTSEGVVSLEGTLPNADAIARAEAIAARVSGVVTIENSIERDLSVEQNLSIFNKMSDLFDGFVAGLPLFAVALLVAVAFAATGYLIAGLRFIWDRIAPNAFLGELIRSAIRFVFVVGGIVIALDMIGAGALLGAVLGGAGVVGIALGFAMRDTIENYVASLMLSLRQPFRANDHVLIDDLEGHVIRLTSRATILMTLEGNHLRIPNSQVFKAVIVNFTRNPQRRFEFELGIDADDDPRNAMQLGRDTMLALPFVLSEPEPMAKIEQVGDSNIVISFLAWVDQREADFLKSRSLAIASVKDALEDAGFALPEPIYRLRFDGRTDPLPIGRSKASAESKAPPQPKSRAKQSATHDDVRPESKINEMVENERRSGPEQQKDLLDSSRPVE